jgi:arylsulfatase A-like enzyme
LPAGKIDGVDILPLLLNQQSAVPRDELAYYYRTNNLEAVRKGQWKLMLPHISQTYIKPIPGKDGFPVKTGHVEVPLALYNLRTDPGETIDLQSQYPEVVKQLIVVADKYRADLGDELTKTPCTNCRPAARVEK